MRRLIPSIILAVFLLSGCMVIREYVADAKACAADPVCLEKAKASGAKGKEIGEILGASIPVPGGAAAGAIGGYGIMFLIALLRGGKNLKKVSVEGGTD